MELLITCPSPVEYTYLEKELSAASLPQKIDLRTTGIGTAHCLYNLSRAAIEKYDWLLQCGIAGRIDKSLSMGESYLVGSDCFGDVGVWEDDTFRTVFDMSLENKDAYPYTNGALVNPHIERFTSKGNVSVSAVSVNQITTLLDMKNYFRKRRFQIESMEGAAFHYFGLMSKKPFLQIRAISNDIGERNKAHWRIEGALSSLTRAVLNIIQEL